MKRYQNALLTAVVAAFVSIASMIALLPSIGIGAQSNLYMPTTGVFNGLTAANTINAALGSLNSCNSGSAAPTNALGGAPVEGECWLDTTSATAKILKRYSGSGWLVEGVLDVTNGRWQPPIGGGTGSVASAGTTDLCASPQAFQTVSGTTTITSFGSNCVQGIRKTLVFSGVLTLTHNSTSLIIPGGLSKTTANGDVAEAVYLGSGNWRVVSYVPIGGTVVTSLGGATGIITLSNGVTISGNDVRLALNSALTAANPSAPSGITSTGGGAMAGLGVTTCRFTPSYSTRAEFVIEGNVTNNTGGQSTSLQLRYGSGAGPAFNGVPAGTALTAQINSAGASTVNPTFPFHVSGIATGLTPATTYWFDVAVAVSANTGSIANLTCTARELL